MRIGTVRLTGCINYVFSSGAWIAFFIVMAARKLLKAFI